MTLDAYPETLPTLMKRGRYLGTISDNVDSGEMVNPERTRPGNDMQYGTQHNAFDNRIVVVTAAVLVLLLGLLLLHFLVRCMLRRLLRQAFHPDNQPQQLHKTPPPMKDRQIRSLPCFIFRMGDALPSPVLLQQTCPICLSEFVDAELIRVLPGCFHSFHAACLDEWLRRQATCPTCRADIPPLLQVHVVLDLVVDENGLSKHSFPESVAGMGPSSSSLSSTSLSSHCR
ncbi:hypothetical protein KP509_25G065700 [Ceratopteris richardii]|uniref:RING-type domain-containing protein n=1 Tax=Ceratopteris richardii TaxID=49495 RepID=A0A8T2RRY4_CERRI|nr:hypothetical protein KP509_25G065700 [Ceratopteris richardii]